MEQNENTFEDLRVARFKNEFLTTIKFNELTINGLNILFYLIAKSLEQQDRQITTKFTEIKLMLNIKEMHNHQLKNMLEEISKILLEKFAILKTEKTYLATPIFTKIFIDEENEILQTIVNKEYLQFFNDFLGSEYTTFNIKEFINLKSKYTKMIYLILKKWRTTGEYRQNYKEFAYNYLGINEKTPIRNINSKFIKPAIEELNNNFVFWNLETNFIKYPNSKKIHYINFTFTPQKENKYFLYGTKEEQKQKIKKVEESRKEWRKYKDENK